VTIEDAINLVNGDSDSEAVIAFRFDGRAAPGSRVDLRCSICGERVSVNPTNAQRIARGMPVFCRNSCWPRIKSRVEPAKINEIPDPTKYPGRG
jgi:hypothetical protein